MPNTLRLYAGIRGATVDAHAAVCRTCMLMVALPVTVMSPGYEHLLTSLVSRVVNFANYVVNVAVAMLASMLLLTSSFQVPWMRVTP